MILDKEIVIKFIQDMPERISFDQLLDKLELLYKLEEGLKDSQSGNFVALEEAKKKHEKWLK